MKDVIQDFIARASIEATLTNSQGESWYLGPAVTVKPLKDKHHMRWEIGGKMTNISPFTKIILHHDRTIISDVDIRPFFQEGKTVITLDYARPYKL